RASTTGGPRRHCCCQDESTTHTESHRDSFQPIKRGIIGRLLVGGWWFVVGSPDRMLVRHPARRRQGTRTDKRQVPCTDKRQAHRTDIEGLCTRLERFNWPTIQHMRSRELNCALATIAIVTVVAACSRTTEQTEKAAARAVTFNG